MLWPERGADCCALPADCGADAGGGCPDQGVRLSNASVIRLRPGKRGDRKIRLLPRGGVMPEGTGQPGAARAPFPQMRSRRGATRQEGACPFAGPRTSGGNIKSQTSQPESLDLVRPHHAPGMAVLADAGPQQRRRRRRRVHALRPGLGITQCDRRQMPDAPCHLRLRRVVQAGTCGLLRHWRGFFPTPRDPAGSDVKRQGFRLFPGHDPMFEPTG